MNLAQQEKTEETTPFMGLPITKGWTSSNFAGTVRHYATLPNGEHVSSPVRRYLTKRIKKYFKEGK